MYWEAEKISIKESTKMFNELSDKEKTIFNNIMTIHMGMSGLPYTPPVTLKDKK